MSGPITIDATIIAWGGVVCNIAITAFLLGAVYGRLTSKISAGDLRMTAIRDSLIKDIAAIKESLTKDITEIGRKITTPEGEPLLISYKAHAHKCATANSLLSAELRRLGDVIAAHSDAVRNCGEQVSQLTVAVAVLEEKVEK